MRNSTAKHHPECKRAGRAPCRRVGNGGVMQRVGGRVPYPRTGHVGTQEAVRSLGAQRRAPQTLRHTCTPAPGENACTRQEPWPRVCIFHAFPSGPDAFGGCKALSCCVCSCGCGDLWSRTEWAGAQEPGPCSREGLRSPSRDGRTYSWVVAASRLFLCSEP